MVGHNIVKFVIHDNVFDRNCLISCEYVIMKMKLNDNSLILMSES